jgi:hypothetical protein
MRCLVFVVLLPALAGCASQMMSPPPRPLASEKCAQIARQRAEDAAANGYDAAYQKIIFDGDYDACTKLPNGAAAPQG